MKNICFFNHYHNGDIFHSKSFVREIIDSVNTQCFYGHLNDPKLVLDLNVIHTTPPNIDHKTKFFETEDTFYINTWIGSYHDPGRKYLGECTLRFLYEMFSEIYEQVNSNFGTNLKLSSVENYVPTIDYSKFNVSIIDDYIKEVTGKKVLLSNGPCLSGQCKYHEDMQPIVNYLANKYPEITFIVTKPVDSPFENVISTEEIIKIDDCDLNEIGYLSTFCDIIVGRNSGPFCFATNKDNVDNPNISFYCFADDVTTCFLYEIDLECNFLFEYFDSLNETTSSIESLILKL